MKYYKDSNNNIFAYEDDGSQDLLIGDKQILTLAEVEAYTKPQIDLFEQGYQAWKKAREDAQEAVLRAEYEATLI